ncbi:MAG: hypothetical protein AAGK21_05020, partial [Bacteroidota bacterium]
QLGRYTDTRRGGFPSVGALRPHAVEQSALNLMRMGRGTPRPYACSDSTVRNPRGGVVSLHCLSTDALPTDALPTDALTTDALPTDPPTPRRRHRAYRRRFARAVGVASSGFSGQWCFG